MALSLLLWACDSGNPVLPTAPDEPSAATTQVTVSAMPAQLLAGALEGSQITVSVVLPDGSPGAASTRVTANTTLGNFGVNPDGSPVIEQTKQLQDGKAVFTLFASDDPGTASIFAIELATRASGALTVPIREAGDPVAVDFSFEVDSTNKVVLFTDLSTGAPTAFEWNFGDGGSSTQQNPSHPYDDFGTYTVKLTARNATSVNDRSKLVTVERSEQPPVAAFSFQADGLKVSFSDQSSGNPTQWRWDFGDQSLPDSRQDPVYTYAAPGAYSVRLTASNDAGPSSASQLLDLESVIAVTSVTPSSGSYVGGDGITIVGQGFEPPLSVTFAGFAQVVTSSTPTSIAVRTEPVSPLGCADLTGPTVVTNLGSGASATGPNFTFQVASTAPTLTSVLPASGPSDGGTLVTLAGSNLDSSGVEVNFSTNRPATIVSVTSGALTVSTPALPDANLAVQACTSSGVVGQEYVDTPVDVHVIQPATSCEAIFRAAFVYEPTDRTCRTAPALVADFSFNVVDPANHVVAFSDGSSGSPTGWNWDFTNDGSVDSTLQNPQTTYPATGVYDVRLLVARSGTTHEVVKSISVP